MKKSTYLKAKFCLRGLKCLRCLRYLRLLTFYIIVVFLLHTEELETTNLSTIRQLFNKSMGILWSNEVEHEHVYLFVSDAQHI
ncbi:BED-type domain-containing protein [Aphis craccivora]|uniref:BED-type domain-containing protein n=1 Tax=Aphis craccivora TaxID=307492 RepID=A0A6G0XWD5_APHCR|nr:BED-type domain-containing protein [Aphis craccivora]